MTYLMKGETELKVKVIKPSKTEQIAKKKVCAYARVSTDSSEQEDSLENQFVYFQNYIQSNPEWEFVGIYSDQGISGFKENRPEFLRMIADAKAGKIDLIVVKSVSRFARNTETVLKFSRELKNIGVGIFFQLQNINTLSGAGELMLTIIAAFAQAESEGASDGAKLLYRRKFSAGIPAYGLERTFGYTADEDGIIHIVKQEAQTVQLIFDLAEKGIWPSKIAAYLNENGVTTGTGCQWSDTAIFRVLHNPAFKGDMVLQKTYLDDRRIRHKNEGQADQWYIADNHPAIVSPEQWDAVQDVLRKRSEHLKREQSSPTSPRDCKANYPLSGKLFCPRCGSKLLHKWDKGDKEYWVCRTNVKVGASTCKGIWLPATVANNWGEISEPTTVVEYKDEYGMKHYTGYPKEEYESSPDCPYSILQERVN